MTYRHYRGNITIHGPQPLTLQCPSTQLQQLLLFKLLNYFSFLSLYVRDKKNLFHPKSKLHAMQYVGTHDILFSPFIKTLLLYLLLPQLHTYILFSPFIKTLLLYLLLPQLHTDILFSSFIKTLLLYLLLPQLRTYILFSPFIKTQILFLLVYVGETTCKIRRSTDHSTEHFNAGRSNVFNIAKTKLFNVYQLSILILLKLIFECCKVTFLMS